MRPVVHRPIGPGRADAHPSLTGSAGFLFHPQHAMFHRLLLPAGLLCLFALAPVQGQPDRVPSFGPNGTHWPSLVPTPFMYDDNVANTIVVDPNWNAIKNAINSLSDAQVAAGALILVKPGTLPGNGAGSGSVPMLQDIGSLTWNQRVTVAPRDGYGTVNITGRRPVPADGRHLPRRASWSTRSSSRGARGRPWHGRSAPAGWPATASPGGPPSCSSSSRSSSRTRRSPTVTPPISIRRAATSATGSSTAATPRRASTSTPTPAPSRTPTPSSSRAQAVAPTATWSSATAPTFPRTTARSRPATSTA